MFTKLLDKFRAQRKPDPQADERLLNALAIAEDQNPLVNAVEDHLHEQFIGQIMVALNFNTPDDQKLRALERAGALYDAAFTLEQNRLDAKQRLAQRQKENPE